jgi:hypothetical protein
MTALRKFIAPFLALLALMAFSHVALAGGVMCRPLYAATGPNAGTIGGSIGGSVSSVPSQTLYVLNSNGCAMVLQQDMGYFLSQGFYPGANLFTLTQVAVTANQTTATAPTLPAGAVITGIVVHNTTANAVTGGVNIGTAAGGAQVVSALTVGANALVTVPSASILAPLFNSSGTPVAQQLFINAATAFNSASLNVTIFYSLFSPE